MQFLTPLGFSLAALAIPILLLYMLKLRRRQVQVSSTLLWERLLRDQQANTPWQKLKRNLLLFLQLLILAALALALARPALLTPAVASGSVVVLLDASASMNATDVAPSRFEAARRIVQTLVDGLSGGSRMTLILVGATPRVLAASETDRARLGQALAVARPAQGGADWQSAFALAAGALHGEQDVTSLIVSDGGLPGNLPSLPGELRYIPVGNSGDNLAVSALALRPAARGPELFAQVSNYSDSTRTLLLSIYLGDKLLDARSLTVAPGGSQGLTFTPLSSPHFGVQNGGSVGGAGLGIYKAQISDPQGRPGLDALPLDDTAFAVYQAASARRVLLVSAKGNLFLEQLLASLPGIQPFRALPGADGALQIPNETFDLYMLDGLAPTPLPAGNLLFVDPPANDLFTVGAPFKQMDNLRLADSPLTRYVDWSNVHILQAKTVQLPGWADALVSVDAGPLVFAGATGNRRVAAVTFDLHESDLPLQVAYPILFSNLIDYLVPPAAFDASQSLRPGESLSITPPPGVGQVLVASPSGKAFDLPLEGASLVFTETGETGYYAVNFIPSGHDVSKGGSTAEYFAVNLFDPAESNIRPRASIQVGRSDVAPAGPDKMGQLDLWPWLAAAALLVLLIEWQAYHRRSISPPLKIPGFDFRGRVGGGK